MEDQDAVVTDMQDSLDKWLPRHLDQCVDAMQ